MRNHFVAGMAVGALLLGVPVLLWTGVGQAYREQPAAEECKEEPRNVQEIVVHAFDAPADEKENPDAACTLTVSVGGEQREMAMEEYLTGVLMAEVPATFEPEALRAQAVAARTYALRQLAEGKELSDDHSVCQGFLPKEKAEEKLGAQADMLYARLHQAVTDTAGQVLTYEGKSITATYFSCSGGTTEAAAAVWGGDVPYLVSVDSPGEEGAAGYESQVTFQKEELKEKLGIEELSWGDVTYTEGNGVKSMEIGEKSFTGVELRSLLGLKSTCFTVEETADTVTFYVKGYGHRVGLSQYGAQAMALQGSDYREILAWYYPGTELVQWGK